MSDIADSELIQLAREAGANYHILYGEYPKEIGIHLSRLKHMTQDILLFREMTPRSLPTAFDTSLQPPPGIKVHVTHLSGVIGVSWNDVYVDAPELGTRGPLRSGEALARMAKSEFDLKCK